jgi:ribonuclease P/MRP protein subunit POP5
MVRIKNRYLLVNILYPGLDSSIPDETPELLAINQPTSQSLTNQTLLKGIRSQVSALFGDYGSGAVSDSLMGKFLSSLKCFLRINWGTVKYLSHATSTFILRVSRAHYKIVWAALSFMNTLPGRSGKKCVFRVVRVSGTIRKCEEEAIRRAKEMMIKARRELEDKKESTLDKLFGTVDKNPQVSSTDDIVVVDASDSDGESSNGDG